jgi:O-antigen ligase
MGFILQLIIFLKPWLGSVSLDQFPFRDWKDAPIETQLSTTLMGYVDAGFVLFSAVYLYRHQESLRSLPFRRIWFVFLGLLLITSVAIAPLPLFALRRLVKVSVFFSMYALTFVLVKKDPSYMGGYLKWLLRSAWIPVLYGLGDFAAHAERSWAAISNREYREYSTFLHANPFAYFCVVILLVVVVLWRYRPENVDPRPKWALAVLAILVLFALASTGTRAAIAGAFVAYLLTIRISWRFKIATISLAVIALLQIPTFSNPIKAVGQVALGSQPTLGSAMLDVVKQTDKDELEHTSELIGRVLIWTDMMDGLRGHYLLGHGLSSSAKYFEEETGLFLNSHNDYITLMFETGISGLFLYWSVLVGIAWLLVRHRRGLVSSSLPGLLADGALFLIVFLGVASFTDNLFVDIYSTPLIWSFLGAATASVFPRPA